MNSNQINQIDLNQALPSPVYTVFVKDYGSDTPNLVLIVSVTVGELLTDILGRSGNLPERLSFADIGGLVYNIATEGTTFVIQAPVMPLLR